MAYIGLRKPIVAKATIDETTGAISYGTPFAFGKAVSFNDSPNIAEASLYGDDTLAESEKAVTSSALSLGTTDIPDQAKTEMYGHKKSTEQGSNEIAYNVDDESAYVGFGVIGVKKVDGVRSFEAGFYPKTQWEEPSVDKSTRGENTEFTTPSTNGTALPDKNGDYKFEESFPTETAAIAWMNGKFGVTGNGN